MDQLILVTPASEVAADLKERAAEWLIWDSSEGESEFHVDYEAHCQVTEGHTILCSPHAVLTVLSGAHNSMLCARCALCPFLCTLF